MKKYTQNLKSITVNWKTKKGKVHTQMQDFWDEFAANPNLDGYGNLDLTQNLWFSSLFVNGSAHTRYHLRRTNNSNKIPLKLEVIDASFHDIAHFSGTTGEDIRYGIKFVDSKPETYYYLPTRWQQLNGKYNRIEIPADELNHMFIRRYPDQWIGIPMLAPVLLPLYELDDLADATVAKQKAAQAISWIIENTNPLNPVGIGSATLSAEKSDNKKEKLIFQAQGGSVQYLDKNEKINFFQSGDIGANLLPFIGSELRRIASAIGIPYYQMTGDYSGIDFSTLRGIAIELRNRIEFIHHFYTIPLALVPLTNRFKELANLYSPKVSTAFATYQLPRWYGVDELKDAQSDVLEVQNGLATLESKLNERHTTFEQIIADRERIKEIGLDNLLFPNGKSLGQTNNSQANTNSTGNA